LFWRKAPGQGLDEVSTAILGGAAAENAALSRRETASRLSGRMERLVGQP
jgi:hypothetical protein